MRSRSVLSLAALWVALASLTGQTGSVDASGPEPTRRLDYRLLLRAEERYRALAADTTIPAFAKPPRRIVRPGDSLATAAQLHARLVALGDLPRTAALDAPGRYTGSVVEGVRRFQARHGLDDDGIIGPKTVAALQVPLALRIPQIELSLEHIRKEPPLSPGPFIIVNVPAYRLFAFDGSPNDSAPALDMKVIVGKAVKTPTPPLVRQMRYLEFHPAWNVPRSILVKEIVPKLLRDPSYLQREGMELVGPDDAVHGDKVSPAVISSLRAGNLRVRQRPGVLNPLGMVKFVIPNDSNVYLHDTPEKSLFSRPRRDFSHGCIRLEKACDLAAWVMSGQAWNDDSVRAAMSGAGTRRVALARSIPVLVEYNTVLATADGLVWFLPDVYGRDSASVRVQP